jgi:hypothetical protein
VGVSLAQCPACQQQVSTEAIACPGCGHPLRAANTSTAERGRAWLGGWRAFVAGGVVVLLAFLLAEQVLRPAARDTAGAGALPDAGAPRRAAEECQRLIRQEGGATRQVEFPPAVEATVEVVPGAGGSAFTVRSYFSAGNLRGEPLRTTYTCTLRQVGENQWQFVSLNMP